MGVDENQYRNFLLKLKKIFYLILIENKHKIASKKKLKFLPTNFINFYFLSNFNS